jgi:hypothetical protein
VAIYTFPADAFVIQGDPEVIGEWEYHQMSKRP